VPTSVGLVEVDEVGVNLLGPAARRQEDLVGEDGEGHRKLELGRVLSGGDRCIDRSEPLPVEPCCRRRGVCVVVPLKADYSPR